MSSQSAASDLDKISPQVTARPGTKRHLRQVAARRGYFNIVAGNARAEAERIQARIDVVTMLILAVEPIAGHA